MNENQNKMVFFIHSMYTYSAQQSRKIANSQFYCTIMLFVRKKKLAAYGKWQKKKEKRKIKRNDQIHNVSTYFVSSKISIQL